MFVAYGGLSFLLSCKNVGPFTNTLYIRITVMEAELLAGVVVGTSYILVYIYQHDF